MIIRICRKDALKPGEMKFFSYGLFKGILLRDEEGFRAYKNFCPHMGGPVRESGDCHFECLWHKARFDRKTGRAVGKGPVVEGMGLPPIAVRIEGEDVCCDYEPPKDPFSD